MKYEHPSAIYPGTFDPLTRAHLSLILDGARMFPSLTVIVATNPEKKTWFTREERAAMIRQVVSDEDIRIEVADNYVPKHEAALRASYVIRGLRTSMDFDYENRLMRLYRRMNPRLKPVYIPTFPEDDMDLVSSSMVKSLVGPEGWQEEIKPFLPAAIYPAFVERAIQNLVMRMLPPGIV